MILQTALNHFTVDLVRSRVLLFHGRQLEVQPGNFEWLAGDLMRASWMMAVGALDAFFCDAYGDLIARTFRAKQREPGVELPGRLNSVKVPATVVLTNHLQGGWLWRMVARELIEKDNVLSIDKIKELFNPFLPNTHKLFSSRAGASFDRWMRHPDAKRRLFGVLPADYTASNTSAQRAYREAATECFAARFDSIFQRRHDCIHNCDRPKIAIQDIGPANVAKTIHDVGFLVHRCHEELLSEFPEFLRRIGFNGITRNQVLN